MKIFTNKAITLHRTHVSLGYANIIHVSATETGIGMNNETMNKLFKIHEIDSREGTEKETGTGLGLILCKTFIEKHGEKYMLKASWETGAALGLRYQPNDLIK